MSSGTWSNGSSCSSTAPGPWPALGGPTATCDEGDSDGLRTLLDLPFHEARALWTDRFERTYLRTKLEGANGVVLHAAESAEIPRQTFHRLMRKHGI